MMAADFTARYHETAGRYQHCAVGCLDRALGQDDPTEKAALLNTARLWLALSALAKKLEIAAEYGSPG